MLWKERLNAFLNQIERHEVFLLSGSLAYTTALALAPFVIILLSLTTLFQLSSRDELVLQIRSVIGPEAGAALALIVNNAERSADFSGLSGLLSFVVVLVSASAIFYQLRIAFDKVNEFQADPSRSSWWLFLRDRILSVGLVLGFIFLLMISLFITTLLSLLFKDSTGSVWENFSLLLNLVVFSLIFAAMFRFIPSGYVSGKRSLISGFVASLCFLVGKSLISLY